LRPAADNAGPVVELLEFPFADAFRGKDTDARWMAPDDRVCDAVMRIAGTRRQF
jgi:hypothetical protein